MAKPTENLDWATNGTAQEIVEPTTGMRTEGIKSGGSWYRENLNWMFNGVGKWIDYLRDNVLEWGTGASQARNNGENDARFVQGREGTGGGQFRNNSANDARFLQHSEVVDDLSCGTSGCSTLPLSAYQGKLLKDQADTALVEGITGTQGRNNTQNDARFVQHSEVVDNVTSTSTTTPLSANQGRLLEGLVATNNTNTNTRIGSTVTTDVRNNSQLDARFLLESNNLSDLTSTSSARSNLGIVTGTLNMNENSTVAVNLGRPVVGAVCSWGDTKDNASSCGVSWSGNSINLRNSHGSGYSLVTYIAIVV